ncbi:hypothetical protein Dimus_000029 [Dionaea muscipula]
MTKCFNTRQKQRRAVIADRKRALHGDAGSGKLKTRSQPHCISGKRHRKLLKKWRREQKEALEKGLVTMEDIEMAAADGSSQEVKKPAAKFHLKKSVKIKAKKRKQEGKMKRKSTNPAVDAMVE